MSLPCSLCARYTSNTAEEEKLCSHISWPPYPLLDPCSARPHEVEAPALMHVASMAASAQVTDRKGSRGRDCLYFVCEPLLDQTKVGHYSDVVAQSCLHGMVGGQLPHQVGWQ